MAYYILLITDCTDNYKPSGGSWFYNQKPRLFKTKEQAEKVLYDFLVKFIDNTRLEYDKMEQIGFKYFTEIKLNKDDENDEEDKEDEDENKEEYINKIDKSKCSLDDLYKIMEHINIGTYAPKLIEYEIYEVNIE